MGMSANALKTFKHAPTLWGTRFCCCYSVCSYLLLHVKSTVAVILCARTTCLMYKVMLLLFFVFVPPVSGARYCCCYSLCSYRLFQVQGAVAVILCACTACFRCKVLLLLFSVLVQPVSSTICCCRYSMCSCRLFQAQDAVAVMQCARCCTLPHSSAVSCQNAARGRESRKDARSESAATVWKRPGVRHQHEG